MGNYPSYSRQVSVTKGMKSRLDRLNKVRLTLGTVGYAKLWSYALSKDAVHWQWLDQHLSNVEMLVKCTDDRSVMTECYIGMGYEAVARRLTLAAPIEIIMVEAYTDEHANFVNACNRRAHYCDDPSFGNTVHKPQFPQLPDSLTTV
jgi:hypothetical protein